VRRVNKLCRIGSKLGSLTVGTFAAADAVDVPLSALLIRSTEAERGTLAALDPLEEDGKVVVVRGGDMNGDVTGGAGAGEDCADCDCNSLKLAGLATI